MLGGKFRFLVYEFILEKHREPEQYTLKQLVETGTFKYLKSSTEEFAQLDYGYILKRLCSWRFVLKGL
jgi:hypothetical protein